MKPALIIGSTCVDVIIHVDHLPVTAEDLCPTSQRMILGGCAYNVAYMMRMLAAPHTFISPVGGGMYGDYVAKQFRIQGMPISVRVPDQENGCCYCLVEASGERTFLSCHGVEYTFQKRWMDSYHADNYGFTYVCGLEVEEPTGVALIDYLENHPQLEVCYAPGPRGGLISPRKTARLLDLQPMLHLSRQEARELTGEADYQAAARELYGRTGNTVIVTLGSQGAWCLEPDGHGYLVPGVPVDRVADTIGAGDAHIGTVLACLTKGTELRDAVEYANAVAGAVVGVEGSSLPEELLPQAVREAMLPNW